jgi:hypothetical protein
MRAALVPCVLLLLACATPASAELADVAYPQPHYPSMSTAGTATTVFPAIATTPAVLSIRDATATLRVGGLDAATESFPVTWVKQTLAPGQHAVWTVRVTGTTSLGPLDLQGAWNPTVGVGVCTMGWPQYCSYEAEGPIALTGHAGATQLELAGIAFDTYSTVTPGPYCLACEAGDLVQASA